MNWSILSLDDFHSLKNTLSSSALEGSDSSLVNIFLLQKKYNTQTAVSDGFLFRYYTGKENRRGYGFPLALEGNNSSLKKALSLLLEDSKANDRPLKFCLFDERQKNEIDSLLKSDFPQLSFTWASNRDDCDYIYQRDKLALLPGKTFHKKKNHLSKFLRTYDGKWEFRSLNLCNISDDMILVAKLWLGEKLLSPEISEKEKNDLILEHEMIRSALINRKDFALDGGVLYTEGKPVAMTLASKISDKILDVHFEKCLLEEASKGAYAAINWCFANSCDSYEFLNREEDMGVEGLRKAKLSYHPFKLLEKFYTI